MRLHRYVAYVCVGGVLATLAAAAAAAHTKGAYYSREQVRFLAPTGEGNTNTLQLSPRSMVMVAGAVGQMIDDDQRPRAASQNVTITGMGIRNGWSVTLPNTGGQWANNYTSPYLDVQVAGPSATEVATTMRRVVARIRRALATLQRAQHVAPANLIRTQLSSLSSPPIYYQRGSRMRAVLAVLALGFGVTTAGAGAARRFVARRAAAPEVVAVQRSHATSGGSA
jgi:hypothetical protein